MVDMAKEVAKNLKELEEFEDLWLPALLSSNPNCLEFLLPCAESTIEILNNKLADENHNVVEVDNFIIHQNNYQVTMIDDNLLEKKERFFFFRDAGSEWQLPNRPIVNNLHCKTFVCINFADNGFNKVIGKLGKRVVRPGGGVIAE